jgi:hypothetical protein
MLTILLRVIDVLLQNPHGVIIASNAISKLFFHFRKSRYKFTQTVADAYCAWIIIAFG